MAAGFRLSRRTVRRGGCGLGPDATVAAMVVPVRFGQEVRRELKRVLAPPYEAPSVVVLNALLVTGAWFLLPPQWLFRVHTARVFPITLAVWMLADVPATNLFGSDARRMGSLLAKPGELRRVLAAKNAVLWLLVTPACAVVAAAVGVATKESVLSVLSTIVVLVAVPLGTLPISAWLGIVFPYHTMSLAARWQHRRPVARMIVRWLVLLVLPYLVVPFVAGILVLPLLTGRRLPSGSWMTGSDLDFALGVVVVSCSCAAAWFVGHAVSVRLVRARSANLSGFLADPMRG